MVGIEEDQLSEKRKAIYSELPIAEREPLPIAEREPAPSAFWQELRGRQRRRKFCRGRKERTVQVCPGGGVCEGKLQAGCLEVRCGQGTHLALAC